MADAQNPQTSSQTITIVISCITCLATLFACLGTFLLYKGYQSGELLVGGGLTAAGTLGAMLSSTRTSPDTKDDVVQTSTTRETTTTSAAKPPIQTSEPQEVIVKNDPKKREESIPVTPLT